MLANFRSALFIAALALLTVCFSLAAPALALLPRIARWRAMACWNRSVVGALRLCCGLTHRVVGRENLPDAPYVICSKHQSAWETIAFSCIFPPTSFVAKRELLFIPCFGWGFAVMSPIAIDRGSPRRALRAVMVQGRRRIEQGFCVCVYPEGSRIEPGRTARFAASGIQLAAEAGVPAVPVALNSGRFWRSGSWRKQSGCITVSIGKPQQPQRDRIREATDAIHEWIAAETEAIGG